MAACFLIICVSNILGIYILGVNITLTSFSQGSHVAIIDVKELKCKNVEDTQIACQVLFKSMN
jgi:hypothetical protein